MEYWSGAMSVLASVETDWQWHVAARLLLAGLLGAVVGLEREYHGRAAGLRTHMLVCTGCCLVMLVSLNFGEIYPARFSDSDNVLRVDPARLAYSVMGGIGFMGAGAILKTGITVRGLTTAACLWCVASIGLAVGMGLYILSLCTASIVIVALLVLSRFEKMLHKHWYKVVTVICNDLPEEIEAVERILESHAVKVLDVAFERNLDRNSLEITYDVRLGNRHLTTEIYKALADHAGLHEIKVS